ncbi:MAG: helix-turn-helix domain-containing protein [Acidobacteriota bacterium]
MDLNPESLRYILGLKLRQNRLERGWGLKDVAARTKLSVSYLSEIEKGRKYPKPDKLIQLSKALDIAYDDLVSPRVDDHLGPVRELFSSPFLREFPFHLFGIEPEQVVGLVTEVPSKAGALLRTFLEIGRSYDLQVEHFLFAALRSYQQLERNYFTEVEEAAEQFLDARGWRQRLSLREDELRRVLDREHGYVVDSETLGAHPDLADLRSVYVDGDPPRLLINGRLQPSQRAFALGRELGYAHLGRAGDERSQTSSALRVESFDQVIHDFEAAYFSGAILLQRDLLVEELGRFFAQERWSAAAFAAFLSRHDTTPETFFYRLSQILPHAFGFDTSFFVRFHHRPDDDEFKLTKILNMTPLPFPLNAEPGEHYCRLWPCLRRLRELGRRGEDPGLVVAAAERSCFVEEGPDEEYLVFTLARPLSLSEGSNASVSVGFRLDDKARETVGFLEDPTIARRDVHFTCERCPLRDCRERAHPAVLLDAEARRVRREKSLDELLARVRVG